MPLNIIFNIRLAILTYRSNLHESIITSGMA